MANTVYLTKIEEYRQGLKQMCVIRMFDEQGRYMCDNASEKGKVAAELVDRDIGFIVRANYNGSEWAYIPRGMGPLSQAELNK